VVAVALLMFAAGDAAPPGMSNFEVAQRAEEEFRRGVELKGDAAKAVPHFRAAADYFDELRRRGASNAELYRNLGNASLLANDLPRAVLSYRRGLRLSPTDPDLLAGLDEARKRVVYAADGGFGRPSADGQPPWLPRAGSEWFFAGAAVCYVAACVLLTRWLMTRRGRLLATALVALLAAAGLTVLVVLAVRSEREDRERPLAVVSEDGVLLRKGDGLTYPPRYDTPLNKGAEARRVFERDGWVQIELSGGEIGWAPRDCLLIDEP
jgi:tetratricopeptide (TPR) repeat protein